MRVGAWGHAVAVIAVALLAACGGDHSDGGSEPSSTTSAGVRVLAGDRMVAVCLTDQDELNDDGFPTIVTDLCTVSLDGDRFVIRNNIDSGQRIALSPDRTRVAFIDDGSLHLIDVDGSDESGSEVLGSAPEWIDGQRVGLVTGDRTITAVEVTGFEVETYLDDTSISMLMPTAFIDGFAVSEGGDDVLFSLFEKPDRTSGGFDQARGDRSALGHFDVGAGSADLLIGPLGVPLGGPEFGPGDQFLVSRDNDIHRGTLGSSETTLVSPEQWLGVTPTWSQDGVNIAWLANGVGRTEGPAVLMFVGADDTQSAGAPFAIVGNHDGPLERFPAFPDW